jgi:hypothetical protein
MKFSLALSQQLDCNRVCKMVMDIMNTYQHHNGDISQCLLVMEIKKPVEHSGDTPIPKIENKE